MTTILTKEARLGDTVLDGQVLALDIDGIRVSAPTLKKPWYKIAIDAVLPDEGCPGQGLDVRWLAGPTSKLKTLYVLAVFEPGTFVLSELVEQV